MTIWGGEGGISAAPGAGGAQEGSWGRSLTSQPIRRRKPWSSREIPPITATVRMPRGFPNLMVSSSICWASSRVGARMMA